MFTADFFIDSVQSAKKQFVSTFVTNESFKKELNKLIDSQTEFAKGQFKTTFAIAEAFYKNATDAVYAATKASK